MPGFTNVYQTFFQNEVEVLILFNEMNDGRGRSFKCFILKLKTFLNIPEVVFSMEDGVDAVGVFTVVDFSTVTKHFFNSRK